MNRAQAIVDALLEAQPNPEPWERDHYRELQDRIAKKKALNAFSGHGDQGREKAKAYFSSPHRYEFSKMREYTIPNVTPAPAAPAKPSQPSEVIKGRQRWMPKHMIMPKPWTNWR